MKMNRSIRLTSYLLFFCFYALNAQSIDRSVVASQGATSVNPSIGSIEWTLGETVTETFDDCFLTQGFNQTFEISGCGFTNIDEVPLDEQLMVFPNPATDKLNIVSQNGTIKQIYIFNIHGALIMDQIGENNDQQIMPINSMPAGQYIIRVQLEKEILNQQFTKID